MYIYDRIILTLNVRIFSHSRRFTFWCGLSASTTKASVHKAHVFQIDVLGNPPICRQFIYLFILTHSSGALPIFSRVFSRVFLLRISGACVDPCLRMHVGLFQIREYLIF